MRNAMLKAAVVAAGVLGIAGTGNAAELRMI
jgi:hypothetical protein